MKPPIAIAQKPLTNWQELAENYSIREHKDGRWKFEFRNKTPYFSFFLPSSGLLVQRG